MLKFRETNFAVLTESSRKFRHLQRDVPAAVHAVAPEGGGSHPGVAGATPGVQALKK